MNVRRFRGIAALILSGSLTLNLVGCGSDPAQPGPGPGPDQHQEAGKPTANAGVNRDIVVGKAFTLDGSASKGASEKDVLTYEWAITGAPKGSAAALDGPSTKAPKITADVEGSYAISLVVSSGTVTSAPATITLKATKANTTPVAKASISAATAKVGDVITLDGSTSDDADGDTLNYEWSIKSAPKGSTATLSSSSAAKPTFSADQVGDYEFDLAVNDNHITSDPVSVKLTASAAVVHPAAIVKASAKTIDVGGKVTIDGSASTSPDPKATITYEWTLKNKPDASKLALTDVEKTAAKSELVLDVEGSFLFSLVIKDGKDTSAAAEVTVTAAKPAAVINVTFVSVTLGNPVKLDGSKSTAPDSKATITYAWKLTSQPKGSTLAISATDAVAKTFSLTPDLEGEYDVSLTVNDGTLSSDAATAKFTVHK